MPSQKPRIALTVPNELNDILERLYQLTGTPKSKLIVEILEETKPVFEQMISALEQIQESKENAPQALKSFAQTVLLDTQEKLGVFATEVKTL